jgi:hypothetical protein
LKAALKREIERLEHMTTHDLRAKYAALFGEQPAQTSTKQLRGRIAWRMQAQASAGLSDRAKARATELANELDLRVRAPREDPDPTPDRDARLPMPGTKLTRAYRGNTIHVTVLEEGFHYAGATYRSLSAVAKAATGAHWNGFAFFGLAKKGGR